MKINSYTTSLGGGAGKAATRFVKEYENRSIQQFMHTIETGTSNFPIQIHKKVLPNYSERIFNKLLVKNQGSIKGNYEILTTHKTKYRIEQNIKEGMHHLHWIANFINWETFFMALKSPLIWTLHDMNPFQGVFHYSNDIINNPNLIDLERAAKKEKAKYFNHRKVDAAIVTPSKWLMEQSLNSNIFKGLEHFHINNGIDLSLFKPLNSNFCRNYFNIDLTAPTLLFAADSVSNTRKGFDLLVELVPELNKKGFQLISIGKNAPLIDGINHIGNICDEKLMPLVYNSCDAFLLPSREDNLPNTMVEAMACGKSVISFKIGGMADTIKDGLNGFFANELRSEDFYDAIMRWKKSWSNSRGDFNSKLIREFAEKEFDVIKQSEKYLNLYRNLI